MQLCQFVDDFRLDQRGIHIESNQAAVAPVDTLSLECDIDIELVSQVHEAGAQFDRGVALATAFEFNAGIRILHAACE